MWKLLAVFFLPVAAALAVAPAALAAGSQYVFEGGTAAERSRASRR